jgi:hypothetical protein
LEALLGTTVPLMIASEMLPTVSSSGASPQPKIRAADAKTRLRSMFFITMFLLVEFEPKLQNGANALAVTQS